MSKTSVEIIDLRLEACIGCLPEEKMSQQEISIDVMVYFDASKSCQSDNLADTIDYLSIRNLLLKVCAASHYHLVERLAQVCLENLFEHFPKSQKICLKIKKFRPAPEASHVGFAIEAQRPS